MGDKRNVRVHVWKDMGALIDKFISSDIAGDVQQLLSTLDYLSALSPPVQQVRHVLLHAVET